jgi:hypothetical protein
MDFVAFLAATLFGYLVGNFVPDSAWAALVAILASYHLFLLWLVFRGEHKAGISLPIGSTILTHLACLILIVPIGFAHHLPFFEFFRFGVAGFAVFERNWLFSGNVSSSAEPKHEEVPVAPVVLDATGEDFEAWRQHLAQRKATHRTAGMSVREEYEQWLHTRTHNRGT